MTHRLRFPVNYTVKTQWGNRERTKGTEGGESGSHKVTLKLH